MTASRRQTNVVPADLTISNAFLPALPSSHSLSLLANTFMYDGDSRPDTGGIQCRDLLCSSQRNQLEPRTLEVQQWGNTLVSDRVPEA